MNAEIGAVKPACRREQGATPAVRIDLAPRWRDVNAMIALSIGVPPLIDLLVFAISNLNQRVAEPEMRKL
jgi:hypothetical protein